MRLLSLPLIYLLCFFYIPIHAQTLTITNPSKVKRENESFVLTRENIEKKTGKLTENKFIIILSEQNKIIPAQQDDVDQDGNWDELAFQITIPSTSSLVLKLKITIKDSVPAFEKKTQAYLGISREKNGIFQSSKNEIRPKDHIAQSRPMLYQYEGIGWENDKVAFRSYFDDRNGKDIFGKTTSRLILDSIGLPGKDYHQLSDWGMDILKVGNSLGAGALAVCQDTTLYRLGTTDKAEFKLIANGPVRSIIRLKYTGWQAGLNSLNLTEDINIWAGNYYYQSSVFLEGNLIKGNLVTGIVNLKNLEKNKTISSSDQYEYICSFANQSENHDLLGMGILYSKKNRKRTFDCPAKNNVSEIGSTYAVELYSSLNKPAIFYFFSGWEKSSTLFKNEKGFKYYMDQEAVKLYNPSKIKLSK